MISGGSEGEGGHGRTVPAMGACPYRWRPIAFLRAQAT